MNKVNVTNPTMNLQECKDRWFLDQKNKCWCLEDILYTDKATTPQFQRLSIFVPEAYMGPLGEIKNNERINGYNAENVPIIFENNSAGYMQMPHVWLDGPRCYAKKYLDAGFVYVSCGNRGHESKDQDGKLCGKAPINLIDLKTAIRFLRHNHAAIPGDMNKIISVGWSAGGAMSTLLAVTGNNNNYSSLLEKNGAFMEESDSVFASQIYCPIIDLEHADLAYEWMFLADKENESSPAGPAGVMSPFQEALSKKLFGKYVEYFNELKLRNPENHEILELGSNGRSGSGYEFFMSKLNQSASKFLCKLGAGELPSKYSVEDYLEGNYICTVPAPMPEPDHNNAAMMRGHAGPGEAMQITDELPMEPPSLGEMLSRPPKGMEREPFVPPTMEVPGKNKMKWLSWDGKEARISDLDSYVLNHRRRMKPCTSFDVLAGNSGENKVYGTEKDSAIHFNTDIADAIAELKDQFPSEYDQYFEQYNQASGDKELERKKYLINPLMFIQTKEQSDMAEHYRIRVGASDADTSLSVSMTLFCKLAEAGKDVNYEMVWDEPHSEADYEGEVIEWIKKITR